MGRPKRLSNSPNDIHEDGLTNLWRAVISEAVNDLDDGGRVVSVNETPNMKLGRQLDGYHWLMTERSDLAFESQGVYCEEFRENIRTRLQAQRWVLPQGAVTRISTEVRQPAKRQPKRIADTAHSPALTDRAAA